MDLLKLEKNDDGVFFAYIDCPGDRVNTLSEKLVSELEILLDDVGADHFAKALVFMSGKKDNFIAGADIRDFDRMSEPGRAKEMLTRVHALFNRISNLHYPTIAAINGACLGGGLELALACHFRIATDSDKTLLGLPEVKLGLMPAAGGTERLTRVAGVHKALPLMLTGKHLSAAAAKALRIVDIVVYPGNLPDTVRKCVPYLGKKFPRKNTYPALFSLDWLLRTISPARKLYFQMARRQVEKQTADHYPAPFRIIDCVEAGIAGTMADGLKAEIEAFGPLVLSPQSQSLRRLFFVQTGLKKRDYGKGSKPVGMIGIVGSGFMGTGIAAVSAQGGYRVAIKDVSKENLSKSLKQIWKHLDKRTRSRKRNPVQRDKLFSLVVPTVDYSNLGGAGLVIEAVFEDLAVKRDVLREVEAFTSADCVFASNTSAIPISSIAEFSSRPENVVGMHYFSPVQKMPLLEVVATERCADWALSTAVSIGRRQGKTVIVVKDGPGFYTTRILNPFMLEAIKLVEEGAAIEDVDAAIKVFGFPIGPLRLLDEVGIDVAAHVARELDGFFADRGLHAPAALERILGSGYAGKKKGAGFYLHQPRIVDRVRIPGLGPSRPVNAGIYSYFGGDGRKKLEYSEIQKRLVYLMLNEAALCLEGGTIASPEDGDIGAVFGLGFPPFLGGPFRHFDLEGAGRIVSEMEKLAEIHGPRFEPAPILLHMAENDEKFYMRD